MKIAIAATKNLIAANSGPPGATRPDPACLIAGATAAAIGSVGLVGWICRIEVLKRVYPTFVAINPVSSMAITMAGTALCLLSCRRPGTTWHRIGQLLAAVVAVVGALKILSVFTGWEVPIDQLFFRDQLAAGGAGLPNRMASNTALGFVFTGLALLLINVQVRSHRPSELLSVVSGASGLLALVGYLYRTPTFYLMGHSIPMALQSSVAFIALAIGTLFVHPREGIMVVVTSDTAGGLVARRLLPLAVVLPIALGLLRLYGQQTGLYDVQFGTALYSTALVFLLLIFTWSMARLLFQADTEKKYIEQWQSEKLERTVKERTRKLEHALRQLKTTQQQVLQQERLHALGTMASGVTHDFNNALSVILGFGEMALHECEGALRADIIEQYLRSMIMAALDGANVVTRLREFYRPTGNDEPRLSVDLNMLVEQAVTITQPRWKSQSLASGVNISVQTDLEDVPAVAGDAAELREALANLIFNATDAMPNGGAITLRTRYVDETVCLQISDTGTGMTKEVQRKCLDPFFTTKGDRGTGLGLAMVYGIIQRHGGTLTIDTVEGHGTTFLISLPQHTNPNQITEALPCEIARPLRVLIADDQPLLCEILAEYLKNDCHTVTSAGDGVEALEKFDPADFDVVITDQAMPEMSGNRLARAIKDRSPSTPVILLTGFGEASGDGAEAIDHVLGKPVSLIELRHALVRVTSTAPSTIEIPSAA